MRAVIRHQDDRSSRQLLDTEHFAAEVPTIGEAGYQKEPAGDVDAEAVRLRRNALERTRLQQSPAHLGAQPAQPRARRRWGWVDDLRRWRWRRRPRGHCRTIRWPVKLRGPSKRASAGGAPSMT